MNKRRLTKHERNESAERSPITDEDKKAIGAYYYAELKKGRTSDQILEELSEWYLKSTRQLQRYVRQYADRGASSLEETPHPPQMRDLARRLTRDIAVPGIVSSLIVELEPRYIDLDSDGLSAIIDQDGRIQVQLDLESAEEIEHLYRGLESHLNSDSDFSKVMEEIDNWKAKLADNLTKCHELLAQVKTRIERKHGVTIPSKYNEEAGYTIYFPLLVCADAIERAGRSIHFKDFQYRHKGLELWFGAFLIYKSLPGEKLARYKRAHKRLRARYAEERHTKIIAEGRKELYQTAENIRRRLREFADRGRLPGHCELCP